MLYNKELQENQEKFQIEILAGTFMRTSSSFFFILEV